MNIYFILLLEEYIYIIDNDEQKEKKMKINLLPVLISMVEYMHSNV